MNEIEKLVVQYGEQNRDLIIKAIEFIDIYESSWNLDKPINRETYIAEAFRRVVRN